MSEHYGPFDKYSEVMLDNGGVFGLRVGETLDVQEDGSVIISAAEIVEEEAEEVSEENTDETIDESSETIPDAAAAFAEAQQNPEE